MGRLPCPMALYPCLPDAHKLRSCICDFCVFVYVCVAVASEVKQDSLRDGLPRFLLDPRPTLEQDQGEQGPLPGRRPCLWLRLAQASRNMGQCGAQVRHTKTV